ncbi:hypothetical protein WA1_00280 [Scytonema hofmannii PCC 7110]|uniref:Uncharacterized protein n=1 Tax=Scytonema hofmannii PCC 7110 TaxID=128403 RepID=A0A139XG29_9CYAN|nr:hypothetical protein [Scytonema hofmannii]KYC43646.1 hypothetical protein WA1_00280 [Scytonema hofmannii PCC 7110]
MERKVTIKSAENRLTVAVSEAQTIEIFDEQGQLMETIRSEKIIAPQIFYLKPGDYTVVTNGKIEQTTVDAEKINVSFPEITQLQVTSDAKDFHKVDGIPEIPADGTSFTTITIQKADIQGNPLTTTKDNDEIFLRTDAGIIKDEKGSQQIRRLELQQGKAAFRLYSEERKRVAKVQVMCADPDVMNTSIHIEFF